MFWEIASLIIQVAQMTYYLDGLDKYKEKLDELADWLCTTADENKEYYKEFRDCDPDFYEYYKTLPEYAVCESAVKRNKGVGFYQYGESLRRSFSSSRGFTPLERVHFNQLYAHEPLDIVARSRANTLNKERHISNLHTLQRWQAVVNAPVGVERYASSTTTAIIQSSFKTITSLSQGFNSAGVAFGKSLFNILH